MAEPVAPSTPPTGSGPRLSRRAVLGGIGLVGAGALAGGGVVAATRAHPASSGGSAAADHPFRGAHQSGIITPAQDRLLFASMTVVDGTTRSDLRDLMRTWTSAAEHMTRGELVGEVSDLGSPPIDTGEALGSATGGLTVTIGYGPSLFDGRFGLGPRKPRLLATLPALPNEELDPDYLGGDLCIQACSDDPQVSYHAVRNLARLGMGVVEHNWLETGFGRTSATGSAQVTPRNLMGFKDGTRNIRANQPDLLDDYVWIGKGTDQPWLDGGSYLVTRRIRMFIENWDRDFLADQQNVFGRAKVTGAPLTGGTEFTAPDFHAHNDQGQPVIPADAHIRLASHEENGGLRILRRGYSFTDGIDPQRGTLLGGLFFIAFMRDPAQFVTLQRKLGSSDALNEYIRHVGSALFVCPPGLGPADDWGTQLFGS